MASSHCEPPYPAGLAGPALTPPLAENRARPLLPGGFSLFLAHGSGPAICGLSLSGRLVFEVRPNPSAGKIEPAHAVRNVLLNVQGDDTPQQPLPVSWI